MNRFGVGGWWPVLEPVIVPVAYFGGFTLTGLLIWSGRWWWLVVTAVGFSVGSLIVGNVRERRREARRIITEARDREDRFKGEALWRAAYDNLKSRRHLTITFERLLQNGCGQSDSHKTLQQRIDFILKLDGWYRERNEEQSRREAEHRRATEERLRRLRELKNLHEYSPAEFEEAVSLYYQTRGFSIRRVGGPGDQGLDIIATLGRRTVGVQCKRYEGAVGNAAVQEAFAGMHHHRCTEAVVITTSSSFTRSAVALAKSTNVTLITGPEFIRKRDSGGPA